MTAAPIHAGRDPILSGGWVVVLRVLVINYVLTLLLLFAANVPPVGQGLLGIQQSVSPLRVVFAFMGSLSSVTFFVLFGLSLYHFSRGYVGRAPRSTWLWVILLLNFVGIVLYWFCIIEPEFSAWKHTHEVNEMRRDSNGTELKGDDSRERGA